MAYTGYKIIEYIDVNPQSPTFNTTKTERVQDTEKCPVPTPRWEVVSSFCEIVSGANTGWYITVSMDTNVNSPTYGYKRSSKAKNLLLCPEPTDEPQWHINEEDSYCETKIYEPSMVEGETGVFIVSLTDDNRFSPTFGQRTESSITESDWNEVYQEVFGDFPCETPSTDPIIEDLSYTCELSADTQEQLIMTGYKLSSGLDKNVYSPTYLEVTTARTYDPVLCPPTNPQPPEPTGCTAFIVDGGEWDNVPQTGDTTCDSAFLWVDGTPQFTPESASTWITINKYYWDTDDPSMMCTNYGYYPCVANNLMYQAGLVTTQVDPCNAEHNPPLTSLPKIVQDAVNKTGKYKHALGTVRYTVAANNEGADRTCTIRWIVDSQECPSRDFTISQLGGESPTGTCDCTTYDVRGSGVVVSSAITSTEYTLGSYTAATDCSNPINVTLKSGDDFIGSWRVSGGHIYGKVKEANTHNTRQSQYNVTQGNCQKTLYVTQQEGYVPPTGDTFQWDWAGHETHYSATTADINLLLVPFSSVYNGAYTNAVLSANVSWITTYSDLYIDHNELSPNINNYIYFSDYNTGSAPRTGTLTLTQKGTSNKITVDITQTVKPADCTITAFTLDSEVCRGGTLGYTFDVKDSRCHETFYFTLFDADGNQYESSTTPTGGHGTGSFTIPSSAATGQCSVDVYTDRHYATIKDCSRTVTGVINNNSQYIIQNATFSYYVGEELRTVNFGGGVTPGSYRQVWITISTADYGKSWVASKVIASATSPETKVDAEMNFTAYPSSTTINDSFVGFQINLSDFKE